MISGTPSPAPLNYVSQQQPLYCTPTAHTSKTLQRLHLPPNRRCFALHTTPHTACRTATTSWRGLAALLLPPRHSRVSLTAAPFFFSLSPRLPSPRREGLRTLVKACTAPAPLAFLHALLLRTRTCPPPGGSLGETGRQAVTGGSRLDVPLMVVVWSLADPLSVMCNQRNVNREETRLAGLTFQQAPSQTGRRH